MGYRIQYFKAGSTGGVLSHVITDRLEREFTIEDLEEWTEYEVRIQALNGIGSGPWSTPVLGRTRESGEAGDTHTHTDTQSTHTGLFQPLTLTPCGSAFLWSHQCVGLRHHVQQHPGPLGGGP